MNFREFSYQEGKRCMLAFPKSEADFLRGCASRSIGHLLFATLSHAAIRELPHCHQARPSFHRRITASLTSLPCLEGLCLKADAFCYLRCQVLSHLDVEYTAFPFSGLKTKTPRNKRIGVSRSSKLFA